MDSAPGPQDLAVGIDIGGTGIKGGLVDLSKGELVGERVRYPTPKPGNPTSVIEVVANVIRDLAAPTNIPLGIALPAPIVQGTVTFVAHLDQSWVGTEAQEMFAASLGRPVTMINDADAAGVAESHFGAAKNEEGTVLVTTLGTGIGTALLRNHILVPNTELGHIEIDGVDAETRASSAQRKREELSWKRWAKRLQKYYEAVQLLVAPDLIVVGGGVSKHHDKFLPRIQLRAELVPAQLRNTAGIVGAAMYSHTQNR